MDCAALYADLVSKVRGGYPIVIAWNAWSQGPCTNTQPIYAQFMRDTSTASSDPNASVLAFQAAFPSAPVATPSGAVAVVDGQPITNGGPVADVYPSYLTSAPNYSLLGTIKDVAGGIVNILGGGGATQPTPTLPTVGGVSPTSSPCSWAPEGWVRDACMATAGLLGGSGNAGAGGAGASLSPQTSCPSGYEWNADSGRCEVSGVGGTVQRLLPGGASGYMEAFQAVMGRYGAALTPLVAGQVMRRDRVTGSSVMVPVLRCLPGTVLGKDDLCYNKSSITNKERKWPHHPALLTRADKRTMDRAHSLENKLLGYTKGIRFHPCSSKPKAKRPARKRR